MIPFNQQRLVRRHKPFLVTWVLICLIVVIVGVVKSCLPEPEPPPTIDPGTTTPTSTSTSTVTATSTLENPTNTLTLTPSPTISPTPTITPSNTPILTSEPIPVETPTVIPTSCVDFHVVLPNEHLWGISEQRYNGDPNHWDDICTHPLNAPKIRVSCNLIFTGQEFYLPNLCMGD